MSIEICIDCTRHVDTDYEEGNYKDEGFVCNDCNAGEPIIAQTHLLQKTHPIPEGECVCGKKLGTEKEQERGTCDFCKLGE